MHSFLMLLSLTGMYTRLVLHQPTSKLHSCDLADIDVGHVVQEAPPEASLHSNLGSLCHSALKTW